MKKTYYGDFETTKVDDNGKVRVYLWCLISEDNEEVFGEDIESFYNHIKDLEGTIYFHNLKFDFSYLSYYMLKNEIKFDILEKQGCIYNVRINECYLRDSLNFMPMTLEEVGEAYCEIYKKTSIDYDIADWNHKATKEEITYCFNDCYVLKEGLTNYFNTIKELLEDAGATKTLKTFSKRLTNAGIAYDAFRELSEFKGSCPKTTYAEYSKFKEAYHGGYVYSNPKGIIEGVNMIDCNSMYPFIYSSIDMPIGKPIRVVSFEDSERFKFSIFNIKIKYELKKGYIPIIGGGVGKYGSTIYKSTSNGEWEDLTICSTDLELVRRFYDCEIEFMSGWSFFTIKNFFKKYADIFIKFKNKYKGIKRDVAKVFLNSPYGKTAMNGFQEIRKYYLKDDVVTSEVTGYKIDDKGFQYFPMAIAITAGARKLLLTTAEEIGFEHVNYMDTDSIKYDASVKSSIKCDPDTLGAWKDEGYCDLFKTIAPKKYVYWHEGVIAYTCAGFSKKTLSDNMKHMKKVNKKKAIKLMNKFDKGLELTCLQSKVVEGGRALIPVLKQMN